MPARHGRLSIRTLIATSTERLEIARAAISGLSSIGRSRGTVYLGPDRGVSHHHSNRISSGDDQHWRPVGPDRWQARRCRAPPRFRDSRGSQGHSPSPRLPCRYGPRHSRTTHSKPKAQGSPWCGGRRCCSFRWLQLSGHDDRGRLCGRFHPMPPMPSHFVIFQSRRWSGQASLTSIKVRRHWGAHCCRTRCSPLDSTFRLSHLAAFRLASLRYAAVGTGKPSGAGLCRSDQDSTWAHGTGHSKCGSVAKAA